LGFVSQADLLTALAKQQGVIVTPESPNPIERERVQREASTVTPTPAEEPPVVRRRYAWIVAAVVGLPLGIGAAIWLATAMKSPAASAALVGTPSAHALPAVALAPTAALQPSTDAPPPPTATPVPSPRIVAGSNRLPLPAVPPAPVRPTIVRPAATFEPTGI
jgi:hypothetical protein